MRSARIAGLIAALTCAAWSCMAGDATRPKQPTCGGVGIQLQPIGGYTSNIEVDQPDTMTVGDSVRLLAITRVLQLESSESILGGNTDMVCDWGESASGSQQWWSDDTTVATVSGGILRATGVGQTQIHLVLSVSSAAPPPEDSASFPLTVFDRVP